MGVSRYDLRKTLTDADRLRLIEYDLDAHDKSIRENDSDQDRGRALLIGVLVSVSTAAILLALNLAVALAQR